jgi:hypothetical protein
MSDIRLFVRQYAPLSILVGVGFGVKFRIICMLLILINRHVSRLVNVNKLNEYTIQIFHNILNAPQYYTPVRSFFPL